jgi:hypothetical protein
VLLQNRNAFGHALITHIAEKAGDKPLQATFPTLMATGKQLKAAILARRAAKGPRKKRTRPKPRQYTIADWERARDRVAAAERRIDNDRTNNPNWDARG